MRVSTDLRPEWEDMQGLILSAYPHLDQAAYLLYRIGERNADREAARDWLAQNVGNVTPAVKHFEPALPSFQSQLQIVDSDAGAKRRLEKQAVNVNIALTWRGLMTLCAVAAGRAPVDFAHAFVEGIAGREHRSRILGDTGWSQPAKWEWGGPRHPVDLLLMVFVDKARSLDEEIAAIAPPLAAMTRVGKEVLRALSLEEADGYEHFGFKDGMSQPILTGTPDAKRFPASRHVTELGEIVFGYPDASGKKATVPSLTDRSNFGKNGTYLVFRQLQQDVAAFRRLVSEATRKDDGALDPEAAWHLASKIVGRRPDGTPLVPYVNRKDNEFGFAEDPYGYGCPIGAHIRRANPRDSFVNTNAPFAVPNLHRVLRRGRSYGEKFDKAPERPERGLLFLCLNADFERQFEFIQQNWLSNPSFDGLRRERDPLVGDHYADLEEIAEFTVQGMPAPTRVREIPRFVRVMGGEYFFLPGIDALRWLAGAQRSRQ